MTMHGLGRLARALAMSGLALAAVLFAPSGRGQTFCVASTPLPGAPPGQSCSREGCKECGKGTGSPCYVGSGVYVAGATDLSVPTMGAPIALSRSYESGWPIDGPFGIGWRSSLTARLTYATFAVSPTSERSEALLTMPDGQTLTYIQNGDGTFSSPVGRQDTVTRNGDGSFTFVPKGTRAQLAFSPQGALTAQTDESGNTLTYSYDANGKLQQIADASGSGRYLNVYWGAGGRVSSVQDSAGRQVTYGYDTDGTLEQVTDAGGRVTHYSYVPGRFAPQLSSITDNWNRPVAQITYDAAWRTQTYTENGETYTYQYGVGAQRQTIKTDSANHQWAFTSSQGLVTARQSPAGTQQATYNPDTSIAQTVDETGVITTYTYNSNGTVATVVRGLYTNVALENDYTYDPAFPTKVAVVTPKDPATGAVNRNWQGAQYDYYPVGSPSPGALFHVYRVKSDGTAETLTTYTYDAQGRILGQTNAAGGQTDYQYAAQGNLHSVTGPANNDAGTRPTTLYGYDGLGRVTSVTDPSGHQTSYTYDGLGRVLTVTLPKPATASPLNFTTTYSYDSFDSGSGLLFTSITDPNGNVTRLGYDQFGRLVKSLDAANNATTYAYATNLLSSITDANGNVTSYSYDNAKRLASTTFPDGASESYAYYADGALKTKTDRKGVTVTYGYDPLRRLTSKSYSTGGSLTYAYTGQKVMTVTDTTVSPTETHTFSYDTSYRPAGNSQATRGHIDYAYDAGDRLATMTIQNGPTATYGYYPDGSLSTINWSPVAGQFKYAYTLAGQYQQVSFPSGQTRGYSYDDQGRLLQLANANGATNLATFAYGYDLDASSQPTLLGQRTSQTTSFPAQGLATAVTRYSYDTLYQLSGSSYPGGAPFNGETDAWSYDAIGNRLTSSVNGAAQTYTYFRNGANPLNSQRLQTDGPNGYVYDPNGNEQTKTNTGGTLTLGYSPENRLASIAGAFAASYGYDYQGRRSTKTMSGSTTSYLYDGQNLVGEMTSGTKYYLFGPGIDEPIAMVDASNAVSYFDVDALGSVVATNDAAGNATHSVVFDAWGNERASTGARNHPFSYTGREVGEAGLLYYRARYYDPTIGRFTQEDPVGKGHGSYGAVVQLGDINWYRYAANNPVRYTDPSGLCTKNCPDCKSGVWWGYGVQVLGQTDMPTLVIPDGASAMIYDVRCSGWRCTLLTVCGRKGYGKAAALLPEAVLIFNAPCVDDLLGWSFGGDFDIGEGLGGGGDLTVGTTGAVMVNAGFGFAGGAAGALEGCYTKKLSCNAP